MLGAAAHSGSVVAMEQVGVAAAYARLVDAVSAFARGIMTDNEIAA